MSGIVASVILISWLLCLAVAAYSAYALAQEKNISVQKSNGYIGAMGISGVIGALLSFKLVGALTTVFGLSEGQATFIGATVLLGVILGMVLATLKIFKIMQGMAGHYTKGFY